MTLEPLILKMISYDHGSPERIQHFLKVHSFAKTIAVFEHLDEKTLFITEAAAIVHDIGIRLCLEKYGDGNGKLQEKEGPALAEQMLSELGFEKDVIERVSFLVGHHHTYTGIDGLDYQILVEADFLVNLFEGNTDTAHIRATYDNIFRTETGKKSAAKCLAYNAETSSAFLSISRHFVKRMGLPQKRRRCAVSG